MSRPASPFRVLFLCTHNSARSILAEALANHLGAGRLIACSAGSHPSGRVNPQALATLQALGINTDGLNSKGWDRFAQAGAPTLDLVVTVCANAAGEPCPIWPGQPRSEHWEHADPSLLAGEAAEAAFSATAASLRERILLLLAALAEAESSTPDDSPLPSNQWAAPLV